MLLMWRHRWIIDRWVWELPGGYVDAEEDPALTAAREVEEETGWRPRTPLRRLIAFQPMVGTIDSENLVYLAHGAEHRGDPEDINEAERVAWIPLETVRERIAAGEIVGSGTVIGLQTILLDRLTERSS